MKTARRAVFGAATWQRCQFHLAQNAVHHAPNRDIKTASGNSCALSGTRLRYKRPGPEPDALVASYSGKHPDLAEWLETSTPEGMAVFSLPEALRKRMRTSNGIEHPVQQELKWRTVKVRVFPNLVSLPCLSTAILIKIDEKRETETNAYIKWEGLDK